MAEDIRPNDAIRAAKKWLADIYADENIDRIGLEGVRWHEGNWEITLGFSRSAIDKRETGLSAQNVLAALSNPQRVFKIVVVSGNDNHIVELRDREVA
jgi:hypothetical protein